MASKKDDVGKASGEAQAATLSRVPASDSEILRRLFPSADAIFKHHLLPLSQIVGEADVVLDTNVLLVPYSARPEGFTAIKEALSRLASESRLFIPARVAREYARHRPEKLRELLQNIMNQKSGVSAHPFKRVPLIEGLPETQKLAEAEDGVKRSVGEYQDALQGVHDMVRNWQSSDPVTEFYAATFAGQDVVVEYAGDYGDLRRELAFRYDNKIPPGYKDASKDDGGEGDLIIWMTILQIGASRKRHLIFVSGDEKSDWQYRANNSAVMPRVELVDEYRRASDGKSFHMTSLSALLSFFETTPSAVRQVETAENQQRLSEPTASTQVASPSLRERVLCPSCSTENECNLAEHLGASGFVRCVACARSFHVHRGRDGIFGRLPRSNPLRRFRRPGGAPRAEDAIEQMKDWFLERYMEPAEGVPYDSAEGGYIYISGGPFLAHDVLREEFGRVFSSECVNTAADELSDEYGPAWVRREDY